MLLSAYVRYVFLCRPGFNLRTSEIFSGVDQAFIRVRQRSFLEKARVLSAYVRDVFWSRPGFDLRTAEMLSGVDQALICVRQRYFLE
jgi:hypothetical protein